MLLEVIPPSEYEDNESAIPNILKRFYDLKIKPDWWKLPSMKDNSWRQVTSIINTNDSYCQGVLLLGLSAPTGSVIESFGVAAKYNICKGFTVGRTIFYEPAELWMQEKINDDELVDSVSINYIELINAWKKYREEIH